MPRLAVSALDVMRFVVVGAMAAGCLGKLTMMSQEFERSALKRLVRRTGLRRIGPRQVFVGWRVAGVVEGVLAVLLGLSLFGAPLAWAVVAMWVCGLGYLSVALLLARGASCGCLGSFTPISGRSVARAALLLAVAIGYMLSEAQHLKHGYAWQGELLVLPLISAVLVLSDDLGAWASHLRSRLLRAIPCRTMSRRASTHTRARVEALPEWAQLQGTVTERGYARPEFGRAWRKDGWSVLEYSCAANGSALVVLAGVRPSVHPAWIRMSVMEEASDGRLTVLGGWDSVLAARQERAARTRCAVREGHLRP